MQDKSKVEFTGVPVLGRPVSIKAKRPAVETSARLTGNRGNRVTNPTISIALQCRTDLKELATLLADTDDQPRAVKKFAADLRSRLRVLEADTGRLEGEAVRLSNELIRGEQKRGPIAPVAVGTEGPGPEPIAEGTGETIAETTAETTAEATAETTAEATAEAVAQPTAEPKSIEPENVGRPAPDKSFRRVEWPSFSSLFATFAGVAMVLGMVLLVQRQVDTTHAERAGENQELSVRSAASTPRTELSEVDLDRTDTDRFSRGSEDLADALERFGNETEEEVLTRVHDANAARGNNVCSFEWKDGSPRLIYDARGNVKLDKLMGRCADAVRRF